jgi:hypothetical protein
METTEYHKLYKLYISKYCVWGTDHSSQHSTTLSHYVWYD